MTETQTQTEFISVPEAAKILGYIDTTVMRLAREGRIAGHQLPVSPFRWRLRRDSVLAYRRREPRRRRPAPPKPTEPTPLELAIDRYEAARFAQGATPVWNVAYADALVEQDKARKRLVAILAQHGRQYIRKGIAYQTDGEELFRYLEPRMGQ